MKVIKCIYCSRELRSLRAKKRHQPKCGKDRKKGKMPGMNADLFSDIYDDMPDGAFFALAEEHGLEIEDFL